MGVEPIKDRLTAPYGFEGRIHHRMKSPSECLMRLLGKNCKSNYRQTGRADADLTALCRPF